MIERFYKTYSDRQNEISNQINKTDSIEERGSILLKKIKLLKY
jgi:hypothetical protein